MRDSIYKELVNICGSKAVIHDRNELIVFPSKTSQIEKILKLANKMKFSIVPRSSNVNDHSDPLKDNSIVLNLSSLDKILSIDRKNRVVMVEPGVTFGDLIPKLKEKGLRILIPLNPTSTASILTAALEKEPITIPRYHWDSSDPLLCTEVVFGTGDLFRTGTAAGPGTVKQQQKSGLAQVNPMGPTQFSPFRLLQGAQGSLGIVTWASLKLELYPSIQRIYHYQSNKLEDLLEIQYQLLKFRLCDELFILNNLTLGCLLQQTSQEIYEAADKLKKWNLIFVISGRGNLAQDKITYLEGEINDINNSKFINTRKFDTEIIKFLTESTENPWRMKLKGACEEIFFLTDFQRIQKFISFIETEFDNLGIYIQPINQGTSYHLEFDVFHEVENTKDIKMRSKAIRLKFLDNGAFFNRPYGSWAKDVYANHSVETIETMKKIKSIFDPNNILNPGVLCFDE